MATEAGNPRMVDERRTGPEHDERGEENEPRDGRRPSPDAGGPGRVPAVGRYSWVFVVALCVALALGAWSLFVAIVGLAFLIFVHELGHFLAAKAFGMRVERFYIGFPPATARRQRGETEYGVGLVPLGGFCKISGMTPEEDLPAEVVPRAYYSKPVWQRNVTIAAGPLMNMFAAVVILFAYFLVVGLPVFSTSTTIGRVEDDSPAAAAGLREGDALVAANGEWFTDWNSAVAYMQAHASQRTQITYRTSSGEQRIVGVDLTTRKEDPQLGYLGVGPKLLFYDAQGPVSSARLALTGTYDIFRLTCVGLWSLVSGRVDFGGDEGAVGPLGIVAISSDAAEQGYYPLLLAFISVNLGIMNLLPILPFDGGHLVLNLAERVRGRRPGAKLVERLVAAGVALLIVFFVYVTWHDIVRVFG